MYGNCLTLGMIFETEILDSEDGRFFQSSIDQYANPVSFCLKNMGGCCGFGNFV